MKETVEDVHTTETGTQKANDRLQENEISYSNLVESVPDCIFALSAKDKTFLWLNAAFETITGWSRSQWTGKPLLSLTHPDDRHYVSEALSRILEGESLSGMEFNIISKSGDFVIIRMDATPEIVKGKVVRIIGFARDITSQRQVEEYLRQALAWQQAIFEGSRDAIFISDADSRLIMVNRAACEMTGYTKEELLMLRIPELHEEADLAAYRTYHKKIMSGEEVVSRSRILRKDGIKVDVEFNNRCISISGTRYMHTVARDITERKIAEEALRDSREQIRALALHLQSTQEEERSRIAREIHDEFGSALTALKLEMFGLEARLRENADGLPAHIKAMSDLIDSTIDAMHRISTKLRPSLLDDLGLTAAIEWQIEEFQHRTGINCRLTLSPKEIHLDKGRSTTIFRILQESLTNIARHAQATRAYITLRKSKTNLSLIVKDNGIGIRQRQASSHKSFGLIGIRERISFWRGSFEISGAQGKGTALRIDIPLEE